MIVRRRRLDRFTIVPNEILRDTTLSWKARGLLAYLLSLPDDWRTSSTRLALLGPDGRDAVRSGLRELEERGYLHRVRRQDYAGRWSTELIVVDHPRAHPVDEHVHDPGDGAPTDAGKPDVGFSGALGTTENEIRTTKDSVTRTTCQTCGGATWIAAPDLTDVEECPECR